MSWTFVGSNRFFLIFLFRFLSRKNEKRNVEINLIY
jgi:hypothetical protein